MVVNRHKYLRLKRQIDRIEEREKDNYEEWEAQRSMVDELRHQLQMSIVRSIILGIMIGGLLTLIIFLFIKLKRSAGRFVYERR